MFPLIVAIFDYFLVVLETTQEIMQDNIQQSNKQNPEFSGNISLYLGTTYLHTFTWMNSSHSVWKVSFLSLTFKEILTKQFPMRQFIAL